MENTAPLWPPVMYGTNLNPTLNIDCLSPSTPHDLTASSLMPANPNQLGFSFNAGQHLPHSLPSPTVHPALQSAPLHEPQGLFVPPAAVPPLAEPPNETQSSQLPRCQESGPLNLMIKSWAKRQYPCSSSLEPMDTTLSLEDIQQPVQPMKTEPPAEHKGFMDNIRALSAT